MDTENGVLELWSAEAFLIFESRFLIGSEEGFRFDEKAGWEVGRYGQRRAGKRVFLGKDGLEIGKWTGFSRLGPDNSTQVVDFPHLVKVRLFLRAAENSRILVRGMIGRRMAKRSLEPTKRSLEPRLGSRERTAKTQRRGGRRRSDGTGGEGGKRGIRERLEEGFGGKWLCSITRIYTQLHAFTQCSFR